MARGINKVIIVGTLGQDPELKYTPNGSAVVNIGVATNESWKNRETEEWQERTEWHRVVMFGKTAEVAGKYLKKGSQAYFEGKLRTNKWKDQSGNDRYTTEIIVDNMQMLGGRGDAGPPMESGGQSQPQSKPAPAETAPMDDGFDDIPF